MNLWTPAFNLGGTLVLVTIAIIGIIASLSFLAKRKLTMAYAMVWIFAFVGLAVLVAFPPAMNILSRVLFTPTVDGTLRLLAVCTIVGFLIFFSVKISVLSNGMEELAQRVGLIEYALRERMEKTEKRTDSSGRPSA